MRVSFLPRSRAGGLALVVLVAASCGTSTPPRAPSPSSGLAAIGAGLSGPTGLRASVYAKGLPTMSAFAFDPQGRLWVTTAAETYAGKDGVYLVAVPRSAPVKVIGDLRTPLGLVWYRDTLYVSSIGRVDAYSDLRGTQ